MLNLPRQFPGNRSAPLREIPGVALLACILLYVLPALNLPAQPVSRAAAGQAAEVYPLDAGRRIERKFAPGESHAYRIRLERNQYFRARIEGTGGGIVGSLCSTDKPECVALHTRRHGTTPLSLIAGATGEYRLEFRPSDDAGSVVSYTLHVEATRAAAPPDENRIAAERAYAEGERLRGEWTAGGSYGAIEKYKAAAALWREAGDSENESAALYGIAETLRSLNDPLQARKYYEAALLLNKKTANRHGEGETLNGLGSVYLALGDTGKAFTYFRKALRLNRHIRSARGEAQAVNNLGEAYYAFGDMEQALQHCSDALARWRDLNDREGQASAWLINGYAHSNLSNVRAATDAFDQSLSLWRGAKNRWGEAHTLTAVGHLKSKLGQKQEALDLYLRARPLFQTLGDRVGEAFILNGMGYVYDELGQKESALAYHEEAHCLFQAADYRDGEAGALLRMGEIYYSLDNPRRALELFQSSLALYRAAGIRLYEPYIFRDIGMVHESLGEAGKALHYFQRALALNQTSQDRRWQAHTHNNIAHVYEGLGDVRRALGSYQRALSLNRATGDRFGESATLYNLARLKRDTGKLDEARTHIQEGLLVAESLRAGVASQTLRSSYFASARQYYELCIDVLMRLHKERPGERLDVVAFEMSEAARARSLLETLKEAQAEVRQGADPVLLERQRTLQQELNAKAERRMQLLADRQTAAGVEALAREIDRLTVEYDELSSRIKISSPRYASLMQPRPLKLGEIQQQAMDDDSLLLEYFIGEQKSYLWAVTRTEITSYELPSRAEIEKPVRRLYELLTARQVIKGEGAEQRRLRIADADGQYWQQATTVARIVLEPVADRLRAKRLLIVSDGILQYIPFQALPSPASDGQVGGRTDSGQAGAGAPLPLVALYEVVNQSSASSLTALRDETRRRIPAPKALAILADPVFEKDDPRLQPAGGPVIDGARFPATELSRSLGDSGLRSGGDVGLRNGDIGLSGVDVGLRSDADSIPRLPASEAEANAIIKAARRGEVFKAVGFDASRSTVMNTGLDQYRIVHFATHGILDNQHPELSGVVLSLFDRNGNRQDGFLRLHDIYNLNLPAELVVLSACNTGLGKDVRGEGLIGLTRGFMYAGSASVVASLWTVDDKATSDLMSHFYRGMLNEGLPPAAALRQSQINMWRQKRWRAPYYWAAFTLQGEYRTSVNDARQPRIGRWTAFLAGGTLVLLLSLGSRAVFKRRRVNRS
jgi:CHAT domain-containing protein/tetratricopeptide (TPR) repeat protein